MVMYHATAGQPDLGAEVAVGNGNANVHNGGLDMPLQFDEHRVSEGSNGGGEAIFQFRTAPEIYQYEEDANRSTNDCHSVLQNHINPTSVAASNTTIMCGCCATELSESDAVRWTGCGHKLHSNCMDVLLEEDQGCPNCANDNDRGDIDDYTSGW